MYTYRILWCKTLGEKKNTWLQFPSGCHRYYTDYADQLSPPVRSSGRFFSYFLLFFFSFIYFLFIFQKIDALSFLLFVLQAWSKVVTRVRQSAGCCWCRLRCHLTYVSCCFWIPPARRLFPITSTCVTLMSLWRHLSLTFFFFYIVGPIFYICVNPFILDFPSLCRFDFDRRYSLFY